MTNIVGQYINTRKNRKRDPYTFANINLIGRCNVDCFFCLGKDIQKELAPHNQLCVHFSEWKNFKLFLQRCKDYRIEKIYLTGQNTDSLQYHYVDELVDYLHKEKFKVGLRTNGYEALHPHKDHGWSVRDVINKCELSVGYSIHSLDPLTNWMIMKRKHLPDWDNILTNTKNPRVSIVLNRCNKSEFFKLLRFLQQYPNIKYIQVRRISTDKRVTELTPDMIAYEEVYSQVRNTFPQVALLWKDAEVYEIFGQQVVFWRTVKTTVNSMNYFTDGTVSDMYFVVEGYLKYRNK
jgi:molybdenum cofactor biosynthesis enzyme MoaA